MAADVIDRGGASSSALSDTLTIPGVVVGSAGSTLVVDVATDLMLTGFVTSILWGILDMTPAINSQEIANDLDQGCDRYQILDAPPGTRNVVITFASVSVGVRVAHAAELTQVTTGPEESAGNQDQTPTTSPTSTAMAATTTPDCVILGVIHTAGPQSDAAGSWSGGMTAIRRTGSALGVDFHDLTLSTAFKIVSATGAYAAAKTGVTAREFTGIVSAWPIDPPPDPPVIDTTSPLTGGREWVAYSTAIAASSGTAPYTYAKTSGTLPPGLTLASNGTLSGTPTLAGVYTFEVTATDDAALDSDPVEFQLTIVAGYHAGLLRRRRRRRWKVQ